MEHLYAWNVEDRNSLAWHYRDKRIVGGFSTKSGIGYKGWSHVVVLYDAVSDQYLPVRTKGGVNEIPWHENTISYGEVFSAGHEAFDHVYQLVENDPFHYDPVQVIACLESIADAFRG